MARPALEGSELFCSGGRGVAIGNRLLATVYSLRRLREIRLLSRGLYI